MKTAILAPMADLTHRALRELIMEFGGCDEYFSEMISARGLLNNGHLERYYTDAGPHPERVVYQLIGTDAQSLADAARQLDGNTCAGIDINMGCSAPHITRGGGGVSWMADPDAAVHMVSQVRAAVRSHRFSVKIRLGYDDDLSRLLAFCRNLEDVGVEMITLHPRTAKQRFKRSARWSFIEQIAGELKIPVIGNGDVARADQLKRRLSDGPWAGVMVGRGAVQQPWLFAAARGLDSANVIDREHTALRFIELLRMHQPPEFWKSRAHRFFGYYSANFAWGHDLAVAVKRETDLFAITNLVRAYFREHPQERTIKKPPRSEAAHFSTSTVDS